jgi:hypothetical protein
VKRQALSEASRARLHGPNGGVEQSNEDRVRRALGGSELWLIQRAYEEWVVDTLDGPDFTSTVDACNSHSVLARNMLHLGRQSVRTRRVLNDALSVVHPGEKGAGRELDCDRLVLKRTFQQGDYGGAAGTVLGVGCITYPRQVPSVLDQHVLKSASSADERDVSLTRSAHNLVSRLGIAIRAAGPNDDSRPRGADPRGITNGVGGHNPDVERNPSVLRRMFERSEGRLVKPVLGRQIDKHGNDDGAHR